MIVRQIYGSQMFKKVEFIWNLNYRVTFKAYIIFIKFHLFFLKIDFRFKRRILLFQLCVNLILEDFLDVNSKKKSPFFKTQWHFPIDRYQKSISLSPENLWRSLIQFMASQNKVQIDNEGPSGLMQLNPEEVSHQNQKKQEDSWQKVYSAPLWLRITCFSTFVACVIINGVIGVAGPNSAGAVSDKFKLYITPPGFIFSIWGLIYTTLGIAILYACIKDCWQPKTHIAMMIVNIFNAIWVGVWSIGTIAAIAVCLFIILVLPSGLLYVWYTMYHKEGLDWIYYAMRNTIAFYAGWVVGATNLNFGIILVYGLGVSQSAEVIIFWVVAPLMVIVICAINSKVQGLNGFLSCLCVWLSAFWAFGGAIATTISHKNDL